MAKTIVIRTPSWLERHPVQIRRLLVRLIFSEATQLGWQIVMDKQRWRDMAPTLTRTVEREPLTEAEWAMIMGRTPS